MITTQTRDAALQRSMIPGNRQRRLIAICRTKAAEFRVLGKRKLAINAEKWAKDLEREQSQHEASGRVIHWQPVPRGICSRKDNKADEHVITYVPDRRLTITFVERGTITNSGVASYLENVDCLVCRRWARHNPIK